MSLNILDTVCKVCYFVFFLMYICVNEWDIKHTELKRQGNTFLEANVDVWNHQNKHAPTLVSPLFW